MRVFRTISHDQTGSDTRQDDWLLAHFKPDYVGTAVELGALDGIHLSNTLKLERAGWSVLCIEPNPRHRYELVKNRKLALCCACSDHIAEAEALYENGRTPWYTQTRLGENPWGDPTIPATVPVLTLDICLRLVGFRSLDVLCLDTDGTEAAILRGANLDFWKPKFVVVENEFSGEPVEPILRASGYGFIQRMGYDQIWGKPGQCAP